MKGSELTYCKAWTKPGESRQLLRGQLQSGFYLSYTGRKSFRILYRLGSCYNLPGLDYPNYKYMGTVFPNMTTSAVYVLAKMSKQTGKFQRNLHVFIHRHG